MDTPSRSIRTLPPLEIGGVVARRGFAFQDLVAASFCLEMLADPLLIEVWCETQDDIVLLWSKSGGETVEFVQVKASELDQLWSVSQLCRKDSESGVASILERSLLHDRCDEPVLFRIVTTRPPNRELRVLSAERGTSERVSVAPQIETLKESVAKLLPEAISTNGNSAAFWVENAKWDTRNDEQNVQLANREKIRLLAEESGAVLVADQVEAIHEQLLGRVKQAAEAVWGVDGSEKKLRSEEMREWFVEMCSNAAHPAQHGIAANIVMKMTRAQLSEDSIRTASDLRRSYRATILSPKYMVADERRVIEAEVVALLHWQRSMLDSGEIDDDGPAFHARCQREIVSLRERLPQLKGIGAPPPDHVLQGYMYNLVDRCLHRFVRAGR